MILSTRMVRNVMPFVPTGSEFDQLVNQLFNGVETPQSYPVDVREDADHYFIDAELPGFTKDQIEITVEKQVLTLSAEQKAADSANMGNFLLSERRRQPLSRQFRLPESADEASVSANLLNGVLTLTLKKREAVKPRKIVVS